MIFEQALEFRFDRILPQAYSFGRYRPAQKRQENASGVDAR
jgi:hypothetical protein